MKQIQGSHCWKDFKQALVPLDNTKEGQAFEELTRLYLLTDPTFATKIKKIWHHSDVPQKIVDELGLQRPEIGVDLIAQVKDGTYWAIQCKYHSDRTRNVTYKELSTFFSITERPKTSSKLSHRLVCTSANGISYKVDNAHPDKLGYLTSADFSQLGQSEFDSFRELLGGGDLVLEPFDPRQHQEDALKAVEKFFNDAKNRRGKIIHPCGSGKSLTGYWISQALKSKKVIIAVPSLALVRQTLGSWTREALANDIEVDWIAVCSDDDVKKSDDPSMSKVELGIEVDTDPEVIAAFLKKRSKGTRILITTYQSGQAVSAGAKKAGFSFDLGIYDEAHKTVGQKDKSFAHLLYDENVKVRKRVFMTATEREFRGNSDEYLSMDDESIYGPIIHQLSFKEALEQNPPILSDYKIVSTIVTKSEIQQLLDNNDFVKSDGKDWSVEGDASSIAGLIALRKLVRERNIKHVVSFHGSIKRSKDFMELNAEASKAEIGFEAFTSFHVSGKDSTGDRAAELERFVDAVPSLITNARCLTEGVDVPAIDAVLFAEPKQSKIDIVQAAGRALRKFNGKDFGYIIVPVVLDDEMENPSDKAFKQIITVISALGMNDERIIEEFKELASGRSSGRRIVEIDFPEISRVRFSDLISNIEIQIWDRLSFGWYKGLEHLRSYVSEHGTARVPHAHKMKDGFSLGSWVANQRTKYKESLLTADEVSDLSGLSGWTWNPLTERFDRGLKELIRYVEANGNPFVPQKYTSETGFKLGTWVSNLRVHYKDKTLKDERIKLIQKIEGWSWDAPTSYDAGFEHLDEYFRQNGTTRVPVKFKTQCGFNLGYWVRNRRAAFKCSDLSKDAIRILEDYPDWAWDPNQQDFDEGVLILKSFIQQYGHCKVGQKYIDENGFRLGQWVTVRRSQFKNDKLSDENLKTLESLPGWTWDLKESAFQEGLMNLMNYVAEHGTAKVPASHKTDGGFLLGSWVSRRRGEYKKDKLSADRINKLEDVSGWVWSHDTD